MLMTRMMTRTAHDGGLYSLRVYRLTHNRGFRRTPNHTFLRAGTPLVPPSRHRSSMPVWTRCYVRVFTVYPQPLRGANTALVFGVDPPVLSGPLTWDGGG